MIATIIINSSIIIQRIILTKKLKQIKYIFNQLSKFEYIKEPRSWHWLHILAFISLLTQKVLLIYKRTQTQIFRYSYLLFGFEFSEEYNNRIVSWILDIYIYLFSIPPMHVFSMLYAAVCLQLVNFIKDTQSLSADSFYDYKILSSSFVVIKSTVGNLDDLISFPLLISTIYFSTTMYFGLNVVLHSDLLPEFHLRAYIFSLFLCTLALFSAMVASASMVADATSEIGTKAWFLQDNINNTTYEKQRFLMYTQKEVNLTLWKQLGRILQ